MPTVRKPTLVAQAPSLSKGVYDNVSRLLDVGKITSEGDLAALVEHQLPTKAIRTLMKGGLDERTLFRLIIPRRTLEHRTEKREPLTQDESDKALRIARIVALASYVFGDETRARQWLRDEEQFDGKSPLMKSSTAAGARQVEERLYQLYFGMFG